MSKNKLMKKGKFIKNGYEYFSLVTSFPRKISPEIITNEKLIKKMVGAWLPITQM